MMKIDPAVLTKMVNHLQERGFYIGIRDPKRNKAFKGKWMVAEQVDIQIETDCADQGGYCVVGDDMNELIRDAAEHYGFEYSYQENHNEG